jgi:hypothetical protein
LSDWPIVHHPYRLCGDEQRDVERLQRERDEDAGRGESRIALDRLDTRNRSERHRRLGRALRRHRSHRPGTQRPAARPSYGTIVSGTASQSAIYFTNTTDGGATWTPLTRIDPQAAGNQVYPDIDANAGRLHVVWQDTRPDTARGPDGSFISVPFQNQHVAANPPGSTSSGAAVQSFYATSATVIP